MIKIDAFDRFIYIFLNNVHRGGNTWEPLLYDAHQQTNSVLAEDTVYSSCFDFYDA